MAIDNFNKVVAAPATPPLAEMVLPITADSISSDPFPKYTTFICVKAEADCSLAFGEDPVADFNYHFVDSGERLWYGVSEGHKIAVIKVGII
jgi:hypothetical protein